MTQEMTRYFGYEGKELTVRVDDNGEPWFIAGEVCRVLDIENVTDTINRLDEDEKRKEIDQLRLGSGAFPPPITRWLVNENGLYNLILGSRKPEAKAFKRWIIHEVLPSIRKTGSYGVQQQQLNLRDPKQLQSLALQLIEINAEQTLQLEEKTLCLKKQTEQITTLTVECEELKPDAEAARHLEGSKGNCCLTAAGQKIGLPPRKEFMPLLRSQGYLKENDMPYQEYLDADILAIKTKSYNGFVSSQTMVTPKGIKYFTRKFKKMGLL